MIQVSRILPNIDQYSEQDILDTVAFTIAYCDDNLLIPGKVETKNILFDITDCSYKKLFSALSLLKKIFSLCIRGFPTRSNRVFVVGVGYFTRKLFIIVYYWIPEWTRNVLIMVDDVKKEMSEWYDLRNVMVKYGGTLPDQTDNFFPPDMSMHG